MNATGSLLRTRRDEVLRFLDVEAFAESDEDDDWDDIDVNEMQEGIVVDDSDCRDYQLLDQNRVISNEEEARHLEEIADAFRSRQDDYPVQPQEKDHLEDDDVIRDLLGRIFVQFAESFATETVSSSSGGSRAVYREGKRSRVTGLPIPLARHLPTKLPPHIFGGVDLDRLKRAKEERLRDYQAQEKQERQEKEMHEQEKAQKQKEALGIQIGSKRKLLQAWESYGRRGTSQATPLRRLHEGEWVCIRRGRYKGDVGLVWKLRKKVLPEKGQASSSGGIACEMEENKFEIWYIVFVVPRLDENTQQSPLGHFLPQPSVKESSNTADCQHRKRKRSTRPPPNLFNPNHWPRSRVKALGINASHFNDPTFQYRLPEPYSYTKWEDRNNHTFRLDGRVDHTMVFGLHAKPFKEDALYPANSMPENLSKLFAMSCHPLVRKFPAPVPDTWRFESGDYVVCSPPESLRSFRGWFVELSEQGHATVEVDRGDNTQELRVAMIHDVQKVFEPGDWIRVLAGPHEGREGFVISKFGSFVGVLEQQVCSTQPDFFVHVNAVHRTTSKWTAVDDIPWRGVAILILKKGPYRYKRGIVKDVLRSGRRVALFLSVYIPDLECTERFMYPEVVEFDTQKPLLDFQPLTTVQKPRFAFYRDVYRCSSGPVPWVNVCVHIVGGEHKGKTALVRGVNKQSLHYGMTGSSLQLTVELQVIAAGQANPMVQVDYAFVREIVTGKPLEVYQPLRRDQGFYSPILSPNLSLATIPFKRGPPIPKLSDGRPIIDTPDHDLAPAQMLGNTPEGNGSATPRSSCFKETDSTWKITEEELEEELVVEEQGGRSWIPPEHEKLYEDIHYEWFSSITNARTTVDRTSTSPVRVLTMLPLPQSSHWILHPKLRDTAIYVEIEGGDYDTSRHKRGACVVPGVIGGGKPVVRLYGRQGAKEVDPARIVPYRERPNPSTEVSLMVVARGQDEHIGKLVRRIFHFYKGSQTEENHWLILGVVDMSTGEERLTSERLEVHPRDLEYVEETIDERRRSKKLFKDVREEAKSQYRRAEIRDVN
ncbi:hypothetical protein VNI00_000584 [Paramarasmius palmivorus]|uniref:KOW domain-containing protein n=1 Tax=Paramarasmius palmivorus TaxID=297713 RepID=A0AAW0EB53_9AGAR